MKWIFWKDALVHVARHKSDGGEDLLNVEAAATPLGRICEPEEVVALVHALVASDCTFLTGQAINLDGGLSAGISDGVWQAVAG